MTAGELLAAVDELRPNAYPGARKLAWLCELEGKLVTELLAAYPAPPAAPETLGEDTPLLCPAPYARELYTAWLFAQIDLHNGEIVKYNQSLALFASAWRQYADYVNRTAPVKDPGGWTLGRGAAPCAFRA